MINFTVNIRFGIGITIFRDLGVAYLLVLFFSLNILLIPDLLIIIRHKHWIIGIPLCLQIYAYKLNKTTAKAKCIICIE